MSVVAELFSVNVYAAANMVTRAIEHLGRTRDAIVNISTATALVHSPAEGYYGASKAALEFLTKAWANEFAPGTSSSSFAVGGEFRCRSWKNHALCWRLVGDFPMIAN